MPLTVQVAVMTGKTFEQIRHLESSPLVRTHQQWGQRLQIAMWIFAGVMVVAFWALPVRHAAQPVEPIGQTRRRRRWRSR